MAKPIKTDLSKIATFDEIQDLVNEGYLEHKVINGESCYRVTKKGMKLSKQR